MKRAAPIALAKGIGLGREAACDTRGVVSSLLGQEVAYWRAEGYVREDRESGRNGVAALEAHIDLVGGSGSERAMGLISCQASRGEM